MSFAKHVGFAAALSFCLSFPASATPPDIMNVRDDLFGMSQNHIFVLRMTADNLGLHITGRNDVLLVATEITTGRETLWPVYRIYRGPDYATDDTGLTERIEVESWDGARNPYDILAEYSGVPALALAADPQQEREQPKVSLTNEALTIKYADGAKHRLETEALFAGLNDTRERLADAIGEYDRMAPITNRELLADFTFKVESCKAQDPISPRATASNTPVQLVRVACDDAGGMISTSHYVIVPLWKAPN